MSGGAGFLQSTAEPIFMEKKTNLTVFLGWGEKKNV